MSPTPLILQLDVQRMHEIDPRNVESLFGLWTVFRSCAETLHEGKRLENMSWRLWGRETLLCPPQTRKVPAIASSPTAHSSMPSLSCSVDSDDSAGDPRLLSTSSQARLRKLSEAEDSALSKSRGSEPHLTPNALERIMTTIQEKTSLEPLSPSIEAAVNAKLQSSPSLNHEINSSNSRPTIPCSTESSCISAMTATTTDTTRQSEHRNSDTSVSSAEDGLIRSGSVVHGFSPAASSLRSSRARLARGLSTTASKNVTAGKLLAPTRPTMFQLGAGSSEDEASSFEQSYRQSPPVLRTSSLSQNLGKVLASEQKKTSFRDIVEQRRIRETAEHDEGAIESSSEEEDDVVDDSAIEEDDEEGEWEDDQTDDGKPLSDNVFKRIDSRPNLASRRSILTQGLNEGDRAQGMLKAATAANPPPHTSTPALRRTARASHNGPSMPASPEDREEGGMMMMTMQGPRSSKPLPIIPTTSNTYALAQSPRSTRRAMLSTELTSSLRHGILAERRSKVNPQAFQQRQAQSMANLQEATENADRAAAGGRAPSTLAAAPAVNNASWNHYFDSKNDYHAKGW